MDTQMCRLILATILFRMAFGASTTTLLPNMEPYDNDSEGVIVNDGGTGEGETNVTKHLNDLEHLKAKEFKNHEDEIIEIAFEDEYLEWLDVCVSSDEMPPEYSDGVLQYLKKINMTTKDLKEECQTRKSKSAKRGKRFLDKGAGIWDKCIIPYVWEDSYTAKEREEALRVQSMFRAKTGFRFVFYNNTNKEMGLSHNNYLRFYTASSNTCGSNVGNQRTEGQYIKACNHFAIILHELGHSLGFRHESDDPASLTSKLVHWNFNNYRDKKWSMYHRSSVHEDKLFYDMTSLMGAGNYRTLRGYGPRFIADEPELTKLIAYGDYYYMLMELQEFNKCYDEFNCSPLPVCEMGGYPSIVNDVCTCACTEGLDPDTKCTSLMQVINTGSWPAGTFSLFKVKGKSCPKGLSSGQMARWNFGKIWEEGTSLSEGKKGDFEFVFDVCTKTTSSDSGEWPQGEYCILKKGACPSGFEEGLIETWGKVPERDNSSFGALPDGKKGQDFEFRFCCRHNGHFSIPISLPNREPFIMYTKYEKHCQKVHGMRETKEKYVTTRDATKTLAFDGSLPYYWNKDTDTYYTYYCVYQPLNLDEPCGGVKRFSTGETTFTFNSPKYPNNPQNSECLWHFESPTGTTMKIEFSDFEVSNLNDAECKSYVELRTVLPGATGYRLCGHHEKKSRLTVYNYLIVKFVSSSDTQQKGFKATVTVLSESEQCYSGDGSNTYSGNMNYSRSFRPCVPWSKVQHCILHQFSHRTFNYNLGNNHCRNTDSGRMPWCYVNAELCERENCDVCMRDQCFDVFPNCASIIKKDAQFCINNELKEAKRGCMKTCGFCDQFIPKAAYTTVSCNTPGAVTGIEPTPVKSSYNIGDEVTYICPTSNVVRKRFCQSGGTWSPLGYVCSGCDDGWTYVRGRCFQYQQFEKTNYWDAQKICTALNSTVAVVDSVEQATEVFELTYNDIAHNGKIHIGVRYREGAWRGDDGSEVSYISWDPTETIETDACMVGRGYNTFYTSWCGWKREVMCSRNIKEKFECEDDLPNCEDILSRSPGMCEEFADYVWKNCRKTCGLEGCIETSSCSVPTVNNAKQIHGAGDSIKQGQYVEFRCNDGFLLKSGHLNRTCLSTSFFNGDLPMCAAPEDVSSIMLFSDVELFRRETYLNGYFNDLEVANLDTTRITLAGKVTGWEFFASEAGDVTFLVWRPNPNNKLEFTLVGKNPLTVTADNRAVRMNVSAENQISVQAGDVIGLVLPSKPVITFSRCDKTYIPQFAPWLSTTSKYYSQEDIVVGKAYTFKDYGKSCRVYSIHVILNPTT